MKWIKMWRVSIRSRESIRIDSICESPTSSFEQTSKFFISYIVYLIV